MSVQKINSEQFKEALSSGKTFIVDFYADWCGPCKMIAPVVAGIAEKHSEFDVYKVNVDEEQGLAAEYSVMSIPTLISFKDGNLHKRVVGAQPENVIVELAQ